MKTPARLIAIFIAAQPEELPRSVDNVRAMAGKGLEGDRYAAGIGTFSNYPGKRDVTLIESEMLSTFEGETGKRLSAAESRRNLLTRGVRLNHLIDREFQIGSIRLRGLRLSEPCTHLARLTQREVLPGLVHRGGLIAEVLCDGVLTVGDEISELPHDGDHQLIDKS
ncbi:MAG TPA: MOSC domain-containing protein [Chthoniobacterales bacterium]|jgi:MOSC domain-containing protein YiiM